MKREQRERETAGADALDSRGARDRKKRERAAWSNRQGLASYALRRCPSPSLPTNVSANAPTMAKLERDGPDACARGSLFSLGEG